MDFEQQRRQSFFPCRRCRKDVKNYFTLCTTCLCHVENCGYGAYYSHSHAPQRCKTCPNFIRSGGVYCQLCANGMSKCKKCQCFISKSSLWKYCLRCKCDNEICKDIKKSGRSYCLSCIKRQICPRCNGNKSLNNHNEVCVGCLKKEIRFKKRSYYCEKIHCSNVIQNGTCCQNCKTGIEESYCQELHCSNIIKIETICPDCKLKNKLN